LLLAADVRKYGEVIGIATTAIARGTHVHVQNLRSRRAKTPVAAPPSGVTA
jgi:SAF domain